MDEYQAQAEVRRLIAASPRERWVDSADMPQIIDAIGGLVIATIQGGDGIPAAAASALIDDLTRQAARVGGAAPASVADGCRKMRELLKPHRDSAPEIDDLVRSLLDRGHPGPQAAAIDTATATRNEALDALAAAATRGDGLAKDAWTKSVGLAIGQMLAWPTTPADPAMPRVEPAVIWEVVDAMIRAAVAEGVPDEMRSAVLFMDGLDDMLFLTAPRDGGARAAGSDRLHYHVTRLVGALKRLAEIVDARMSATASRPDQANLSTRETSDHSDDWLSDVLTLGRAWLLATPGPSGSEVAAFGDLVSRMLAAVLPIVRSGSITSIASYRAALDATGELLVIIAESLPRQADVVRDHAKVWHDQVWGLSNELSAAEPILKRIAAHWRDAAIAATATDDGLPSDAWTAVIIAGPAVAGTAPVLGGKRYPLVSFSRQQELLRRVMDAIPAATSTGDIDLRALALNCGAGMESARLIDAITPATMVAHRAGLAELIETMDSVHSSAWTLHRIFASPHMSRKIGRAYIENPAAGATPDTWISIAVVGALEAGRDGTLEDYLAMLDHLLVPRSLAREMDRDLMKLALKMSAEVLIALADLNPSKGAGSDDLTRMARDLRARTDQLNDPDVGVRFPESPPWLPPGAGSIRMPQTAGEGPSLHSSGGGPTVPESAGPPVERTLT